MKLPQDELDHRSSLSMEQSLWLPIEGERKSNMGLRTEEHYSMGIYTEKLSFNNLLSGLLFRWSDVFQMGHFSITWCLRTNTLKRVILDAENMTRHKRTAHEERGK